MGRAKAMLENEYRYNKRFREYVDKYCNKHNIPVGEALEHGAIRQAYLYYTDT